ncbi:MAG TPA: hypothetical protein VGJ53_06795 [Micromonosporaceae bacterium]
MAVPAIGRSLGASVSALVIGLVVMLLSSVLRAVAATAGAPIGATSGRSYAHALAHGYQPAMIAMAAGIGLETARRARAEGRRHNPDRPQPGPLIVSVLLDISSEGQLSRLSIAALPFSGVPARGPAHDSGRDHWSPRAHPNGADVGQPAQPLTSPVPLGPVGRGGTVGYGHEHAAPPF